MTEKEDMVKALKQKRLHRVFEEWNEDQRGSHTEQD